MHPSVHPFGFICDSKSLAYEIIECPSDRVFAIQIIRKGTVIATIIGVYLPYNDHSAQQMELYMETLAVIQGIIDTCDKSLPILLVGDLNANIPQMEVLDTKLYRKEWLLILSAQCRVMFSQRGLQNGNIQSSRKPMLLS